MTPFDLAQRFVGEVKELPGVAQHPLIQWWLSLCGFGFDAADEIPWCSAFVNGIAWELRLPRSKSAAARSWLGIGQSLLIADARPGYDVAIFRRFINGMDNGISGHVGFFAGLDHVGGGREVRIISGNVGNTITIDSFPIADLLGIRRLAAA